MEHLELTEEEIRQIMITRAKGQQRNANCPQGIGIGREFFKAKLEKRKFLDEATFVLEEGIK